MKTPLMKHVIKLYTSLQNLCAFCNICNGYWALGSQGLHYRNYHIIKVVSVKIKPSHQFIENKIVKKVVRGFLQLLTLPNDYS